MSTSGSYNFTANRDEIIDSALRKAAGLGDWESATTTQVTKAAFLLNSIIKSYHNIGMPVWTHSMIEIPCASFDASGNVTIGIGETINQPKPLKVTQATLVVDDVPQELVLVDKAAFNLYKGTSTGIPSVLYYQPFRITGILSVYPLPNSEIVVDGTVNLYHQTTLQDVDVAADELDFPVEWIRLLVYELAVDLAPDYGLPISERNLLIRERDSLKVQAMSFDVEEGSVFLQP